MILNNLHYTFTNINKHKHQMDGWWGPLISGGAIHFGLWTATWTAGPSRLKLAMAIAFCQLVGISTGE